MRRTSAAFLRRCYLYAMPYIDKRREERLPIIHKCLKAGHRKWTAKKLLEKVNNHLAEIGIETVSVRTIQTDLKYLQAQKGAPIEPLQEGKERYYIYSEPDYEYDKTNINHDQFFSLAAAHQILRQLKGFPLTHDLETLVRKLEKEIDSTAAHTAPILLFEEVPNLTGIKRLEDLFIAIREKTVLKLTYRPFGIETTIEKIIHPYFLKQYNQRWFLFGYDEGNNRLDNSPLDRMEKITPVSLAFIQNNSYDPATYFTDLVGVTKLQYAVAETVLLQVKKERANYVETKPLHHSQTVVQTNDDGSKNVRLQVIINKELVSLLLGFGKDVKVLQPQRLNDKMREEIVAMKDNYTV